MAVIVIYTSGTLGDHLPFIALGQALTRKGHRVRMAINQAMHPYAERFGLEAVALTDIERGPEQAQENAWAWDFWNIPDRGVHPNASPFDPEQFTIQAEELTALCRNADLLISTSIRALGYVAYQALGLPWITVSMNPYSFWQPGTAAEREVKRRSLVGEYEFFERILSFTFHKLGIKKPFPSFREGWLYAKHVLLASSPHFSRPNLNQFQPHSSIDMTGFWLYEDPDWRGWQPGEKLRSFCKHSPLVLSYSSQPLEDPKRVLAIHARAAHRLGRPLLVQRGWAGFSEADLPADVAPENILFADFLPHDWLFSQAACTIQHGGIGSIASALRQGCPLLIEPYGNDQIYNASRVAESLRVGAAMHPFRMTVEGLVQVLEEVLTPECRRRARALGDKMRVENGLEEACRLIDTYLYRRQTGDPVSFDDALYTPTLHAYSKIREMITQENAASPSGIPKILHQTWKESDLPPALLRFQQICQKIHPDWVYILWTDADNRRFIQQHYPWFLRIYDAYPEHIMRVDAVRYFILHYYGGVYLDLDFECVKSLESLLAGKKIVLGTEPDAHLNAHCPVVKPFSKLLCNAFMASEARHPFWVHLFKNLIAYRRAPDPLNATGPFFLTRAYASYPDRVRITVVSDEVMYPVTEDEIRTDFYFDPVERSQIRQKAYGIHHRSRTWRQASRTARAERANVSILSKGVKVKTASLPDLEEYRLTLPKRSDLPDVSCVMMANGRTEVLQRSIQCFTRQTYPRKELIVIVPGANDILAEWIDQLNDESVVYKPVSSRSSSQEDLWAIAAAESKGDYVAIWQTDDLPDPRRLEVQMTAVHVFKTEVCFLEREQFWWSEKQQFIFSHRRSWENSLVFKKMKFFSYASEGRRNETDFLGYIEKNCRIALVDSPQLNTTLFSPDDGESTLAWDEYWPERTESFNHEVYTVMVQQLQNGLELDLSPWIGPQTTTVDDPAGGGGRVAQAHEKPCRSIPRILHQTWKNNNIPPDLEAFRRAWQEHHPDWIYCFWSDRDIREFIRLRYPWFLSVYDQYPEHIMRVDAVRYFIMSYYGGVYIDLDFQCLKPLDKLLEDKQIVVGLEPPAHLDLHFPEERTLARIVCNAFIASVPGHPFWEHVFKQLIAYHRAPSPLDATGPFLLTRAYESYAQKDDITVLPSDRIYPASSEEPWAELDPEIQAELGEKAYAVHHWRGTWWKGMEAKQGQPVKVSLIVGGEPVAAFSIRTDRLETVFSGGGEHPRVSCLMVTRNRFFLARRSVRCFEQQRYENRELIVIDDGEDDRLEKWINELDDERIVFIRLPSENKSLGELRNMAVDRATGTYVTQWDDDDLSDPERLHFQLAVIQLLQTDACFLERQQIWWPEKRRLAVSCRRVWEGSFLCRKSSLPPYPEFARGEDTPVVEQIARTGRAALLDCPHLYTYVFHGDNTFDDEHWESHWTAATESYEKEMYDVKFKELQGRFQFGLTEQTGQASPTPVGGRKAGGPETPVKEEIVPATYFPHILVLVPLKDAVNFLPNFWRNLEALTYPHDRISLGFLESDSLDNTYAAVEGYVPRLREEFAKVSLFKRDYAYRSFLPRWEKNQQFRRRSILAKSRNYLLSRALENEEWVLWIDVDVARWPEDVIERLLAVQKDIVVPHCISLKTGETFDLNTFKLKPGSDGFDRSSYISDGILQPPKGHGRFYLSDLRRNDCIEVDGVGGTMLLVRADLHREGLIFPPYSYKFHIETEGFALMAKDMGYQAWGLPNLEIHHP